MREKKCEIGEDGGRGGSGEAVRGGEDGEGAVRGGKGVAPVTVGKVNGVEGGNRRWESVNSFGKQNENKRTIDGLEGNQPVVIPIRKYILQEEDLLWARKGVTTSVLNREMILMIHNRVTDVGFTDLDIILMGTDKKFVRSIAGSDVMKTVKEDSEFFNLLMTNFVHWDKIVVPFRRGAWLRLYGIMLHAWNESFFKLCVLECGCFLRTDNGSLEKERFDYARVLVSTPSLDIISVVENLLIDGLLMEVKIVEERGFNIGEDACLFEEGDKHSEQSDNEDVHVDPNVHSNVDTLVEKIVEKL